MAVADRDRDRGRGQGRRGRDGEAEPARPGRAALLGAVAALLVAALLATYATRLPAYRRAFPEGVVEGLNVRLAGALATSMVGPPQPGEDLSPRIRFERPWSQLAAIVVLVGGGALVVWLYRGEGSASAWYKGALAGLRIALIALAMLMLSEAVLSVERTGLPYFVVMADDSTSGAVVDQYADPRKKAAAVELARAAGKAEATRLAVAQGWLARDDGRALRDLQAQHKVRLYAVSTAARALAEVDRPQDVAPAVARLLNVEPTGGQTRLGDGVREVLTALRGVPPTAILILSDGQTTDGESLAQAAELARKKGVPLYTIGLGDPEPARDLELSDLLVDDVVFVDDLVKFEARLSARGFAGQAVRVRLRELFPGGGSLDVGSAQVVAPPDGTPARVSIDHRPKKTGESTFVMDIEPRDREIQVDNNRIERTIHVRREKLKVLLVDGEPRYEYRYLKDFLGRDSSRVDLGVVLISADQEYSEQDVDALAGFPTTRDGKDGLFSYDVVILGDVDPANLSEAQMRNLAEFVSKKGGGLLLIAGEHSDPLSYRGTPLEPLLPVLLRDARVPTAQGQVVQGYHPELTAEGRDHPIFRFGDDEAVSREVWDRLPNLQWFFEAPRKQPAARVLAVHPTIVGPEGKLPIIAYQFVGAGKVMMNLADDTWRWRFRVGDRYFGRFWIQAIRFLARSKLVGAQAEMATDRRRYQRGQPVRVRVRFPNPGVAPAAGDLVVQVEKSGQGPRRLTLKAPGPPSPGQPPARDAFEGTLSNLPEGEYVATLLPPPVLEGSLPTARFRVDPPAGELERVQMNEPELSRSSIASGGRFYTPEGAGSLLKDLPAPQKVPLDTDPPFALWSTWPALALFLALLTTEWVMRKRAQMV